ncbi:MAG: hypothetical protein WBV22_01625 [Anaerolineaceae bacterium]
MKTAFILFALIVLTSCSSALVTPQTPAPVITLLNPWLGQTLPGFEPVNFRVGPFLGDYHSSPTFTPDGEVAYWAGDYGLAKIYTSRYENDSWTDPAIIDFSSEMTSYRDPFVSPDGKRLYFISEQVIPGALNPGKENIWMMEKEGEAWGTPQPLPASINGLSLHWTVSVASNYNLYFSAKTNGYPDIYFSRYIDGVYTDPILLDAPINSAAMEITPNIAPDESYLLFSRLTDGQSPAHLFISYAQDSGWTEPQRVENIPYCINPIVTPDRNYLIYMSSSSSFAWRDTSFIEELRP